MRHLIRAAAIAAGITALTLTPTISASAAPATVPLVETVCELIDGGNYCDLTAVADSVGILGILGLSGGPLTGGA